MPNPFSAYSNSKSTSSFRLGQVFGITVQIHWMWFLLPLLVIGRGPAALFQLLVLFGIVFLHELGHCMAARHFGIQVLDITFWPLGGMARMSELPEDPKIEGVIAAAGPLVNFALAAVGIPLYIAVGMTGMEGLAFFLIEFIFMNLILGGFNLIPAFPMDGGRILRAYLARKHDWVNATEMAVKAGRIASIAMLVGALIFFRSPALCIMPFIIGFIWFAGARELWSVRLRHGHSPLGNVPNFGGFGAQGPAEAWAETEQGFPRPPQSGEPEIVPERQPGRGFSESELKRLEGFRGRLQKRPPSDD